MVDQVAARWTVLLLTAFGVCGCSTEASEGSGAVAGSAAGGSAAGGGAAGGSAAGGSAAGGGAAGRSAAGGSLGAGCDAPGLLWKTAQKTWYTSYPDPGSEECVKYNGCTWAGQFSSCDGKKPEAWVSTHDIVAAFPDYDALSLHDLCLKSGSNTIVVTVLDTCSDADCDGCCTQNQGNADELIDVESYTNDRWGVEDGPIQWADLGPTKTTGCD